MGLSEISSEAEDQENFHQFGRLKGEGTKHQPAACAICHTPRQKNREKQEDPKGEQGIGGSAQELIIHQSYENHEEQASAKPTDLLHIDIVEMSLQAAMCGAINRDETPGNDAPDHQQE